MKKLIVALLLATSLIAAAQSFRIIYLNTPQIKIGAQYLTEGDTFDSRDPIYWSSVRQAMKVLTDRNEVRVLSKKLLEKLKAKTLADYLLSIKNTSSRGRLVDFPVTVEDHRAILQGSFVLLDTLTFNAGWLTDETSYFQAQINRDPRTAFRIPAAGNTLVITRDLLPADTAELTLTVTYIEEQYNDTTRITDSLNIEIAPLNL